MSASAQDNEEIIPGSSDENQVTQDEDGAGEAITTDEAVTTGDTTIGDDSAETVGDAEADLDAAEATGDTDSIVPGNTPD